MSTGDHGPNGESDEHPEEESPPSSPGPDETLAPPPVEVDELARACIEFVKKATGMELDYAAETLPVLDHYVRGAREQAIGKPEVLSLVAPAVGCYLGEVARRRLSARWHAPPGEHRLFRLELVDVFLSTNPIGAAVEALLLDEAPGWGARFRLLPQDEPVAQAALANFPEVEVEEYYAPSSRLETLEIIADALASQHLAKGEPPRRYEADDYGWTRAEAIDEAEASGAGSS